MNIHGCVTNDKPRSGRKFKNIEGPTFRSQSWVLFSTLHSVCLSGALWAAFQAPLDAAPPAEYLPSTSNDRPLISNDRPSTSGDRPSKYRDRPSTYRARSASPMFNADNMLALNLLRVGQEERGRVRSRGRRNRGARNSPRSSRRYVA